MTTRLLEKDASWYQQRLPGVAQRVHDRLAALSRRLGTSDWLSDWLDGDFSAGDLMMVEVLERVMDLVAAFPNLVAYVARAEDRAAFKRAFAAQLAVFTHQ